MRAYLWFVLPFVARAAAAAVAQGVLDNEISSPNGSCGGPNGYTCYGSFFGNCCSADGQCSSKEEVCGAPGCQSKYGFCSDTKGKVSPFGQCGGDAGYTCEGSEFGQCCSAYGYCGSGNDHCGSGCQKEFGACKTSKRQVSRRAISCPTANKSTFKAANGDTYSIECSTDFSGGDIAGSAAYTESLDECLDLCSKTATCVNVSWVKGSPRGACYPKNSRATAKTHDRVWGGRLLAKAGGTATSTVVSVDASGVTKTNTVIFTSSAQPVPSAAVSLCPNLNGTIYTDACGATYAVECGNDRSGATHTGIYTISLEVCIRECSKTADCVGVSWVKGSPQGACYMKKAAGVSRPNSGVFGARKLSACTATSSTSSGSSATTSATSSLSGGVSPLPSGPANSTRTSATITSSTLTSSTVSSFPTNSANGTFTPPSTCNSVVAPTAGVLPNCRRCAGQPGTDKFCGYDINTNWYEHTPKTCNVVHYDLFITNTTIAPDGITRLGLLINGQMPGPAIRASWGDTVVVKVHNQMQDNGTSIHFHGIRMLNNNLNDGVVSITQCPIAPGDSMTYVFTAENYGSSWYHSHYAIQTWEGVYGPLIIDGPHSAAFDEDLGPVMLSDWTHRTVDSMYDMAQNATRIPGRTDGATFGGPQTMDNGLINGMNTWGRDGTANQTGQRFELSFTPGKKHLLRLVNTAMQSTYKFSIDGHTMTVISADFVPVTPYKTNIVSLNIGQRYNVIVEADQPVDNYWMRSDNQQSCARTIQARDIKGIVRYKTTQSRLLPTTTSYNYTDSCRDEPYASLVPVVALNAGPADVTAADVDVIIRGNEVSLYKWYLSGTTFVSQFGDPTLLGIYQNNTAPKYSGKLLIDLPEKNKMVYLIIESPVPLPHPIHLHGHDFWILAAGAGAYDSSIPLNLINPPRRDTVTMPAAGFVVIAFVTDNPGVWLAHCHLGWHTSMGFALQIVEMQNQIASSGALANSCALTGTCSRWNKYWKDNDLHMIDSGV